MRALAGCVLAAAVIAGCAGGVPATAGPSDPPPTASNGPGATADDGREPAEQTFGPEYPAEPPAGRPVWIFSAELSADQETLTIHFVGGRAYLASDPCSEDYEPWVAARGDELDVEVITVDRPHEAGGQGTVCSMVGYGHTYHLRLPEPFLGTTVNDLAQGGTLFVGTPPGALVATKLPAGWSLQRAFQEGPGPPPTWVDIYAAAPVENDWEGPGRLVLYQAFGLVGEWTDTRAVKSEARGGHAVAVTMNEAPAAVWFDEASGELLLGWTLGGQSVGLVGNAADMTPQEFVAFAESVAPAR